MENSILDNFLNQIKQVERLKQAKQPEQIAKGQIRQIKPRDMEGSPGLGVILNEEEPFKVALIKLDFEPEVIIGNEKFFFEKEKSALQMPFIIAGWQPFLVKENTRIGKYICSLPNELIEGFTFYGSDQENLMLDAAFFRSECELQILQLGLPAQENISNDSTLYFEAANENLSLAAADKESDAVAFKQFYKKLHREIGEIAIVEEISKTSKNSFYVKFTKPVFVSFTNNKGEMISNLKTQNKKLTFDLSNFNPDISNFRIVKITPTANE
jgi:hypothetical protein